MKKRTLIGVGVAVIGVILGITFLPDEVLIESPSINTSEGKAPEVKKIVVLYESIISIEETEPEEESPVEQVEETVPEEKETEGRVIGVKIKDGVGTQEK
jgi:hypothetical protein